MGDGDDGGNNQKAFVVSEGVMEHIYIDVVVVGVVPGPGSL